MSMPSSFSPARTRALVRLAGGGLCFAGLFLPMLTIGTPEAPGGAHPMDEWQVVTSLASASAVATFLVVVATVGVLLVLAESAATVFTTSGPGLALMSDLAAAWGLAVQLTLDFVILGALATTGVHAGIAWGFVVALVGFLVILGGAVRLRTIFAPMTCVLLAIGSVILGLAWVFFDFFAGMAIVDVAGWLPLLVLLVVVALLLTRPGQWLTTARTLPLVIVALYGLYYLLLAIGALAWMPGIIRVLTGGLLLIALNGGLIWVTRKRLAAGVRTTTRASLSRRSFLDVLTRSAVGVAIGGVFLKGDVWDDPSKHWLLSDLFPYDEASKKLTLAPAAGTRLGDASGLNSGVVDEVRFPTSVADILRAIGDAKAASKRISISGIRHSMGGQALGQHTLHLDMTHMDAVRYEDADQTVTAGPGATWKQVQTVLSPHGRAVSVMQDSNIFTVGGALSVNVHGKDPRFGSLIDTVNYVNVVMVDGNEVRCDRTQNSDLFAAVIGGFGLLGVITEVNLLTTANSVCGFSLMPLPTRSLINKLEALNADPKTELLEAHLSVDAEHFLTDSLIYQYAEIESATRPKDDLTGENSIWLRKVIFQASRASNFGKVLRWELEKSLTPLVEAKTVSRNTAMAVPVRFLQNPDPHTTDVLQEYFVPTAQANDFLGRYGDLIRKHGVNLLNVTVRKVKRDTNALVSYAQQDMYGFVVYYKVTKDAAGVHQLDTFTRDLIDYLIAIGATYYLCYGSYYSPSQLAAMYPALSNLFALKARHDPEGLLTSLWYEANRP